MQWFSTTLFHLWPQWIEMNSKGASFVSQFCLQDIIKVCVLKKSSLSIWHILHNVKLMVNILSKFVDIGGKLLTRNINFPLIGYISPPTAPKYFTKYLPLFSAQVKRWIQYKMPLFYCRSNIGILSRINSIQKLCFCWLVIVSRHLWWKPLRCIH